MNNKDDNKGVENMPAVAAPINSVANEIRLVHSKKNTSGRNSGTTINGKKPVNRYEKALDEISPKLMREISDLVGRDD